MLRLRRADRLLFSSTGINFDRFEEGLRKMALQKQMPYYSLVKCAVRNYNGIDPDDCWVTCTDPVSEQNEQRAA